MAIELNPEKFDPEKRKPDILEFLNSLKKEKYLGWGGFNEAMDWLIYPRLYNYRQGNKIMGEDSIYLSQTPWSGPRPSSKEEEAEYRKDRRTGALKALAWMSEHPFEDFPELDVDEDDPVDIMTQVTFKLHDMGYKREYLGIYGAGAFYEALKFFKEQGNPYYLMLEGKKSFDNLVDLYDQGQIDIPGPLAETFRKTVRAPIEVMQAYKEQFDLDIPWHYPMWRPETRRHNLPERLKKMVYPGGRRH